MDEYIERERVLANATFVHGQWDDTYISAEKIKEIPSADVAPVVRCKDCKYYLCDIKDEFSSCYLGSLSGQDENDFCSYGERKE